ncbi:MAG: HD domain-containing protein [Chloroflexi bacterium]|nr:HD domain-containing protein [Chloroflexota bacterium]
MEVRDPLYGLIDYDSTEEKIIGTSLFQRLRNIKQLALASYVYPGAHHTRFEHCLGTMHLAGRIAANLEIGPEKRKILRLAALLHDIGHGPFSHVSEQVLEKYGAEIVEKHDAENAHELMSILLIQKHPDIRAILKMKESEEIIQLLKKQKKRSLDKDIISGPLDVDKLDYLARDSYFAGVRYGTFDLEKVVDSFVPVKMGSEGEALGIKEEGVYAVEQLLLAKYHMNAQVYRHRIRRITDAMLVRGITLALEDGLLENIFCITDSEDFVKEYARYNDEVLVNEILNKAKGASLEYYKRIKERSLLKEVFCVTIDDRAFPDPIILKNLKEVSGEQMMNIEQGAAQIFSEGHNVISQGLVIADKQSTSNPTFKSPSVKIDSGTIMVLTGASKRELFTSISSVFRNPSIDPTTETLHIYLPLDWIESKETRQEYIRKREDTMKQKLEEIVR